MIRRRTHQPRQWKFSWNGVLCLVAAVVFGVIGYVQVEDLYWLRHRGEVVTGTVVDRAGGRSPWIEVRYVTRAGETVTERTSNGDAELGRSIEVIYDREDPERMQANDWGLGYWFPALFFGAATAGFAIGAFVQLRPRRD
ncbi:hypothetical protein E1263_19860 [Kribbella antibiotica]|uniref:DUF3592 domain-containing protein n=1 Tax=Kribbella antibiotica TaxID=190195 RepID=A0A4R4ZI59_9ACTN|nr:DUF3592 domain-containing protein [Kribbella antibiotica]TDD58273.1 hypothetical protein E1263_19860 [Kribbella antibiotica]